MALKTILLYLHVVHGNLMWKPRLIFLNYRNTEMTLKRMNEIFPEIRFIGRNSPRLWNTSLFILPRFENLALYET